MFKNWFKKSKTASGKNPTLVVNAFIACDNLIVRPDNGCFNAENLFSVLSSQAFPFHREIVFTTMIGFLNKEFFDFEIWVVQPDKKHVQLLKRPFKGVNTNSIGYVIAEKITAHFTSPGIYYFYFKIDGESFVDNMFPLDVKHIGTPTDTKTISELVSKQFSPHAK